ncbi:MAG TPA: c-type cytochrome [bacterium]|jgi:mono/diheme cytochrome c family protein|nr:c-type cytochrome [bacterium]
MTPRARILVIAILLLATLDAARSLYARVGYARPVEIWQPDPATYADLTWPPGADTPATAPMGERVFAQRCAVCHGPDGRGNGPAAPSLIPRPRDFRMGFFKYKSTPAEAPPSDADLIRVVTDGLQASAMPYFRDILSAEEIRAVVAHVKTLAPTIFSGPPPPAIVVSPRVPVEEAGLARGRVLFQRLCTSCHGADGRAQVALKDAKDYPVISRDLTAPWTFRGGSHPEDIWLRITTGMAPGPMPSFADQTTADERWDLVNYVLSLARTPPWAPGGRLEGPGQGADLTTRGRYLVHAEMCGLCHTPINRTGIYRGNDFYLAGGMRVGAYPHGFFISRNLTSDPETGLGRWTEEEIIAAITTGRSRGRMLNFWDMPWGNFHALRPDDARGIARFLKTELAPVRHRIPAPLKYGIIETIAVKASRDLPPVNPGFLTFGDGLWGQTGGGLPRGWPQGLLVAGQWLVLLWAVGALIWSRPPRARTRRGVGRVIVTGLGVLFLIVLAAAGWAFYVVPDASVVPARIIADAVTGEIPQVDPARFDRPEQAALAERGRYVYTIVCNLCHQPSGAGGPKISWKPMGTLYTRNITPDPETGIGSWSDAEIARAIRSGVTRDGRTLHWQGMTWDHASNLDEEDVRSVIAFLRILPPVNRPLPPARPPAPDDCDIYTFYTSRSDQPGCR